MEYTHESRATDKIYNINVNKQIFLTDQINVQWQ